MENIKILKKIFERNGLSKEVICGLLGNIQIECNFQPIVENMNYSSVERLKAVFPSKFKKMDDKTVQTYVKNPRKLGDFVYKELAQEKIRDKIIQHNGYDFRGRGFIQLTGLNNYKRYGELIGVDLVKNPDLASDIETASLVALTYVKREAFPLYKGDLNQCKEIKIVADTITKAIQGASKDYSKGFLKEHLEKKRKASLKFYEGYENIV